MKLLAIKTLIIAKLLLWSTAGVSSNYGFLKNSVISEFTDEDVTMLLEHVQIGLNENRTINWKNEASGNSGIIQPGESSTEQGRLCRYARIINKSRTQQGTSQIRFCKSDEGIWKITPAK